MKRITKEDFTWLDPWAIGKTGVLLKMSDELVNRLMLTDEEWIYLQDMLTELEMKRNSDHNPMPPEER